VLSDIYGIELSDNTGRVTLESFVCRSCKEAFEWGTAVISDGEEAEFSQLTGKHKERHELDEWHAYRNALAAALAGVADESRQACTSAANIVIDRHILPPVGEVRQTYRDCGLFAAMYVSTMYSDFVFHLGAPLPVEDFTNILLNSDVDLLRRTYGLAQEEAMHE
jgi:hypothetical protein